MRLTRKYDDNSGYEIVNAYPQEQHLYIDLNAYDDIKNKLGQLEDIEDELGIDLITLHKSFEEDIWIKIDNKIMFVPYDKKDFVFYEGNINCYPLKEPWGYTVSIDDYGKTWALTEEELL